jgi:hypothetical protein
MKFRVPQFLDIEDKVFGPFTFKQFGYLLGAGAFAYIFWKLVPTAIISFPLIIVFSGTFLALAFVKINDRPFADVLESAYNFIINDKILVWHKNEVKVDQIGAQRQKQIDIDKAKVVQNTATKIITPDKIRELSEKLDILEVKNIKKDEQEERNINLRERVMKRHV